MISQNQEHKTFGCFMMEQIFYVVIVTLLLFILICPWVCEHPPASLKEISQAGEVPLVSATAEEMRTFICYAFLSIISSLFVSAMLAFIIVGAISILVWLRRRALKLKDIPGCSLKMSLPTLKEKWGKFYDFRRFDEWHRG
ncbi:MAG: hypothetical protein H0Z39_10800 [Peptococcaceae bacterium]|nr:hypothetical protein [Peptococcaceae bacterium]